MMAVMMMMMMTTTWCCHRVKVSMRDHPVHQMKVEEHQPVDNPETTLLTECCLRHRAPRYLTVYCVPLSKVPVFQRLRSVRCQLSITRVHRSTFGTCAFWNSLPDHLRDPAVDSEQFRLDLKTYLFAGHSKR